MILMDTDTCIGLLRGIPGVAAHRRLVDEEVAVSFMTAAELYFGAESSSAPSQNRGLVDRFLLSVRVLHTNLDILREFGQRKASLRREGRSLADVDLLIAATALSCCSRLVTGNTKHYDRISGLRIENWLR